MKKYLTAAVLAVALLATLGSASDEEGGDGGSAPTTAGSSGGGETTAAPEGGETPAPGGGDVGETDEVDDVTITACGEVDALGFISATIEVVNNSSQASNYLIEVAFENADGSSQLATGNAYITSLGPEQSKVEQVSALQEVMEPGVTCRLASVDRLAA